MPAVQSSSNLADLIHKLAAQKAQHAAISQTVADTLEQISDLLGALIGGAQPRSAANTTAASPKPGRPRGRRTRQRFEQSGEESVIAFIKAKGNPTTAEVRKHWDSEGRGGSANNALTRLVAMKKLKREDNKGGRGSRYRVA